MLWLVDRFGWEAAHNAPAREIARMLAAESVYNAYHSRKAARDGWAKWAEDNPARADMLNRAMMAAEEMESDG